MFAGFAHTTVRTTLAPPDWETPELGQARTFVRRISLYRVSGVYSRRRSKNSFKLSNGKRLPKTSHIFSSQMQFYIQSLQTRSIVTFMVSIVVLAQR